MARAALGWSIREAAAKAHIGINTLSRFEGGGGVYLATSENLHAVYRSAGVEFVSDGASSIAGGAGVRLASGERIAA